MTIRTRFNILGVVAFASLLTIISLVWFGLRDLTESQRQYARTSAIAFYSANIKASADASIKRDPSTKDAENIFRQSEADIEKAKQVIRPLLHGTDLEAFDQVIGMWNAYDHDSWANIRIARNHAVNANANLTTIYRRSFLPMEATLLKFIEIRLHETNVAANAMQVKADSIIPRTVIPAISIGLLVNLFIFFFSRMILRRLQVLQKAAETIALGEMRSDAIKVSTIDRDELGDMARAFGNMVIYLKTIATVAESMSQADLRGNFKANNKDDVIGASISLMITSLRTIVLQVRQAAELVAASTARIMTSSEQMALTTSSQASSTEQATQSIRSMSDNFLEVEKNVQTFDKEVQRVHKESLRLSSAVSHSSGAIDSLGAAIELVVSDVAAVQTKSQYAAHSVTDIEKEMRSDVIVGMEKLVKTMSDVRSSITALNSRSNEIGQIVDVISEIADQTNLLALNAAIEAARAGDAGRGFAVVADEVRKLAERCGSQAHSISSLISTIRKETELAVGITQQGENGAQYCSGRALHTAEALGDIAIEVRGVAEQLDSVAQATQSQQRAADLIRTQATTMREASVTVDGSVETMASAAEELGLSLKEQSGNTRDMVSAMEELARSVQHAVTASSEVSASTTELNSEAQKLRETVSGFRLS